MAAAMVSAYLPSSSSSSSPSIVIFAVSLFSRGKSKFQSRLTPTSAATTSAASPVTPISSCLISYKTRHTFFPSFLLLDSSNNNNNTYKRENKSSNSISGEGESAVTTETDRSLSLRGLVFDLGPSNSWDSGDVGSPVINRYLGDEGERWFMWYHGSSSTSSSIGLAVSKNGIHWERGAGPVTTGPDVGLVMHPNEDWWAFDTHSLKPSDVLIMSNNPKLRAPGGGCVYFLYYTGFTQENLNLPVDSLLDPSCNLKSLPGLAISQDGRHWARIEGEHHSGALFDVGTYSSPQWDSSFIAAPKVVYHSRGDLRMYYHSWDPSRGTYAIGMARSTDGIKWVKTGKVMAAGASGSFDEGGVKNGHVVRVRDRGCYLMAYEGVSADGVSSIGLVVSDDGLKDWRRFGDGPVIEPEENGWDSRGVSAPYLVQMDGNGDGGDKWRLYYRGVGSNGRTGIGLAVSKGGYELIRFERWRAFRL